VGPRERSKPLAMRVRTRALLRILPRTSDCDHRVRAQRCRSERRKLVRIRGPTRLIPSSIFLPDQRNITDKGATMRLGAYPLRHQPRYPGRSGVWNQRNLRAHRHRYESTTRTASVGGGRVGDFRRVARQQPVEMIELAQPSLFVAANSIRNSSRDRKVRTRCFGPSSARRCAFGWKSAARFPSLPRLKPVV